MIKIGDEVFTLNGEWMEVLDVSYLDTNGNPTSACRGTLSVKLRTSEGTDVWIRADAVKTYEDLSVVPAKIDPTLGLMMTGWLEGLEPRPDNAKLYEIVTLLVAIQYDKEGYYGSSWKGKGEYRGIMANLDRKYDRLDKITDDEINGKRKPLPTAEYEDLTGEDMGNIGESKIDAVADLANYCLLYMTYLKEHYPGAFRVWVAKNVPAYLRAKIPFIEE